MDTAVRVYVNVFRVAAPFAYGTVKYRGFIHWFSPHCLAGIGTHSPG